MFSYFRQWFPVLKCFIYGRQDNRLAEENLNETAIYYCHKRTFDETYENKIRTIFNEKYGMKIDNSQERFVYNIDGGKHSIHIQRRFKQLVTNIIH